MGVQLLRAPRKGPAPLGPSAPSPRVDLMGAAGVPVAKRVVPVVALLFVTMWLVRRRRRRRRARG